MTPLFQMLNWPLQWWASWQAQDMGGFVPVCAAHVAQQAAVVVGCGQLTLAFQTKETRWACCHCFADTASGTGEVHNP
jgi:hypothetical protein